MRINSQISIFSGKYIPDLNSMHEIFSVLVTLLLSSTPERYKIHIVRKVKNVMLLKTSEMVKKIEF